MELPIFGGLVQSYGAAVFITAEDSKNSVHRRLRALDPDGAWQANRKYPLSIVPLPDAGGTFPIVVEERGKVVWTSQLNELVDRLLAIKNLALVILDPLQCFVHADVNADPQAAAITMSLLNMLAAETGATVLATHHVRKEKEAPKSAQEARHLIRGSSALVDQSRVAIVLWTPDEPEVRKICKTMNADYAPNAVVYGAVVKSNDGADRSTWKLLRGPTGTLYDITHTLKSRGGSRDEHLAHLVSAITGAAEDGRPYTKMGGAASTSAGQNSASELAAMSGARLEEMAEELLQAGKVVASMASGSGKTVKWLDIPDGPFARGEGEFAPGANVARGAASRVDSADIVPDFRSLVQG